MHVDSDSGRNPDSVSDGSPVTQTGEKGPQGHAYAEFRSGRTISRAAHHSLPRGWERESKRNLHDLPSQKAFEEEAFLQASSTAWYGECRDSSARREALNSILRGTFTYLWASSPARQWWGNVSVHSFGDDYLLDRLRSFPLALPKDPNVRHRENGNLCITLWFDKEITSA